jgi:7-cyano-7-deazaguanine synthase
MPNSLIVLSGGQDSATTMALAATQTNIIGAVWFDYGQRHAIEQQCAQYWANKYNTTLHTIDIHALNQTGYSALTHAGNTNHAHPNLKHLPATFVPGRNLIFLTLAAALAMKHNTTNIYTGVCETDYSGYPDCRQNTITSLQNTIQQGMDFPELTINTPLMNLNKAQTFHLANKLGVLNDIIYHTHTCYEGDHTTLHAWGYGCGKCPACTIRKNGWDEYQATT